MKKVRYLFLLILSVGGLLKAYSQGPPAPYCVGLAGTGNCNQPGPSNTQGNFINDFINSVNTCGANTNIVNNNSGCCGLPGNYIYYNNSNPMVVAPGQTITMNLQSGIIFQQGFAVFIDWDNNGVFDMPGERVAATVGVPAAGTFIALTFVIPANQPLGTYRMRIRSNFATPGTATTPCGNQNYSETEDYDVTVVGTNTAPSATSPTITTNSPICANQTLSISLITAPNTVPTLTWTGPANFTTTNQNIVIPNAQANNSGIYTMVMGTVCPVTATVSALVVPLPNYLVTPATTTVCQNGSFFVTAVSANPGIYSYQWGGPVAAQTPTASSTIINVYPLAANVPTALVVYSVVVTPTVLNCPLTTTMSVLIKNPPTPTLTMPAPLCNTFPSTFATAQPPGGAWYGNPIIGSNGIITPNIATSYGTLPVSYSITIGSCTAHATGNIIISQYQTAALTGTLPVKCVSDPPVNLGSIVLNTLGSWSGVNTSANTFTPANVPTGTYVLMYYNPSTPYPNICPATSTIAIQVFNPPTPVIAPIPAKCTNAAPITLVASPPGGVWSGNAGVLPGGLYTPANAFNTAGNNSVVYTAGQGSCVASSTATFHVSRFNSAALSVVSLNLCVTTNTIDLTTLPIGTVVGTWSAPSNATIVGNAFIPSSYTTGVYTLTYQTNSFPDPLLCPDKRLLPISVLNPATPTITQVGPFCSADAPFQLSVNPSTGSFIPNSYLSASGVFSPTFAAIGNNVVQYVIGTPTCNAIGTRMISVEAFVPPTIVGTIPDQCVTGQIVNLLPLTVASTGTWSGPGVVGVSFNPAYAPVGVVSLVYSTKSSPSGLCPAQQALAVNVYSLASPVIAQAGPFCNSMPPIKLQATPLGGVFGNNTPAVDVMGFFNPAYSLIGDNIVNYSVSAGPCLAYAQQVIRVEKFISADFKQYAGPYCKNEPATDLNGIAQNPGGLWSGPGITGSIFTPALANIGNNNIINYLTHSETPDLCPDSSAMRIRVNDIPSVSIVRDVEKGCAPVEVVFNTPNTNVGQGRWTLGDGSEPLEGLTVSHTYTAAGTYSVVLSYWDEIGCTTQAILTNAVTVFEVPKAMFSYEPYEEVTIANPDVQFVNRSQVLGGNTYQWQIADMYSLNDVNPMVVFPKAGDYRVTLKATTKDGCTDETSAIIVVKPEFNVFIPNSFSPNLDGINDAFLPVFSVYGLDAKTFDMEIFDRWGTSLYHTKDSTKGWDGTIQNKGSEPLKEDVYVYKVKYKDLEGKIYNKLGYVTLVR